MAEGEKHKRKRSESPLNDEQPASRRSSGKGTHKNDEVTTTAGRTNLNNSYDAKQIEDVVQARDRYFYFDDSVVPTSLDMNAFPKAKYRSRGLEVKTAVHWGQRKLLISEMQLLTYFCTPGESYWIVYVGAAPGSHLIFLDNLYDGIHDWELIDPGAWDHRYQSLPPSQEKRFHLRNIFFDNDGAYELMAQRLLKAKCPAFAFLYSEIIAQAKEEKETTTTTSLSLLETDGHDPEAARMEEIPIKYVPPLDPIQHGLFHLLHVAAEKQKMLFISDVRSGSEKSCKQGDFDLHVYENMRAQEAWVDIVQPTFAMLKFRLPYAFITKYSFEEKKQVVVPSQLPPQSVHHDGYMLLPVWTRPTSTECRLVVPQQGKKKVYQHQEFEELMFFFNSCFRENVYFEHNVQGHDWVDHHFDGAAEVAVLTKFLKDQEKIRRCGSQSAYAGEVAEGTAENNNDDDDGSASSLILQEDTTGLLERKIKALSNDISTAIGSSFERAYTNREAIHIGKAERAGWQKLTDERHKRAREKRAEPIWHRSLTAEERKNVNGVFWKLKEFTPIEKSNKSLK